ncbi:MAG TPA: VWA domain-containing protein [Vicinamibacterales bacterium]|nr:VWA domain-containing protein [Vicinamibacterales bacterium]
MTRRAFGIATLASIAALSLALAPQQPPADPGFSFHTSVALTNVTATVTDANGRFVPNLRANDFEVYEDGQPRAIQQFESERVPVSLGLAIDTSGSMLGDKITAARSALNRFLYDLLDQRDQVFIYRFDSRPTLVVDWTDDRRGAAAALGTLKPNGGTAIYDAVAEAVTRAATGTRRKKAVVVISDGNDTSSRTSLDQVVELIRSSEVLVYAIGIDASGDLSPLAPQTIPVPSPFPGKGPTTRRAPRSSKGHAPDYDRVNPDALRGITDDTGGRTEVIRALSDLDPATANIADELSRQYFIGYASAAPKDGRWHTIEVKLKRRGSYTVRARRGFVAR